MDPHHSTTGEPHGNPHDGIDASLFHIIVGMFYLILAGTSAVRLIQKLRETGLAVPEKVRHTLHVVVAVTLYSAVRALELLLLGVGVISFRGGKDFYAIVPNMFMLLMQSAFVAKWVSHVSEVTLALQNTRFFRGFAAVVVSLVIWVAVSLLIGVAAISTAIGRSPLSVENWFYYINVASCVGYMGNGVVFVVLGLTLRSLWRPATDDGASVARRVLGIALLFSTVSITQGVALCVFTVDPRFSNAAIGFPTVLLLEWVGLVAVMALLTRRSGDRSSFSSAPNDDGVDASTVYDDEHGDDRSRQVSLINDGTYSEGHESDGDGYRSDGAASNNSSGAAGRDSSKYFSSSRAERPRSGSRRARKTSYSVTIATVSGSGQQSSGGKVSGSSGVARVTMTPAGDANSPSTSSSDTRQGDSALLDDR